MSQLGHALKIESAGRRRGFGGQAARRATALSLAFLAFSWSASQAQEEYTLGPEDVISVTVWESPELSRTVVVRADGTITLPPLGDAAQMTLGCRAWESRTTTSAQRASAMRTSAAA